MDMSTLTMVLSSTRDKLYAIKVELERLNTQNINTKLEKISYQSDRIEELLTVVNILNFCEYATKNPQYNLLTEQEKMSWLLYAKQEIQKNPKLKSLKKQPDNNQNRRFFK